MLKFRKFLIGLGEGIESVFHRNFSTTPLQGQKSYGVFGKFWKIGIDAHSWLHPFRLVLDPILFRYRWLTDHIYLFYFFNPCLQIEISAKKNLYLQILSATKNTHLSIISEIWSDVTSGCDEHLRRFIGTIFQCDFNWRHKSFVTID